MQPTANNFLFFVELPCATHKTKVVAGAFWVANHGATDGISATF